MQTIFINGKFFGQPTTGAQRFATEIVLAMDVLLFENAKFALYDFVLVIPSEIKEKIPPLKQIRVVELAGSASHQWEQVRLPWFVRNSFLINLSGSAPMFKKKQIFTIFDAAIFDFPEAYNRAFVSWYRLLFKVQAKFCTGLFTISKFSCDRLCKHLRVESSLFSIVPCGVDHIYHTDSDESILEKYGLSANSYLLTVGSANPSKNFAALANAFSSLKKDSSVQLVVVGGGNTSVFSDQKMVENVDIIRTGRVGDAQLKALYINARGFVFPSLYEGFGIPPLEAMACDCPVIASNIASIPEVCGNAIGYFDPFSIASIQNALEKIINDSDWRLLLQNIGKDKVKEYTWKVAATKLFHHLETLGVIND